MLETIKGIYESFVGGNIEQAQKYQYEADRIIEALLNYKTIPATKVVMEKMGFAVGNASFPMKRYADEEKNRIVNEIRQAGLKI